MKIEWIGRSAAATALLMAIAILLPRPAGADFDPKDWRFYKEALPSPPGPDGFAAAALDGEVYEGSRGDFADLRLISESGEEIPYVLVTYSTEVKRTALQPEILNVARTGEGQEFTADLGESGKRHNRIDLVLGGINFKRPVTVLGSDDAKDWKTLREGAYIFDFTGDVRARNTAVNYPECTFRFLKIEIGLEDGPPLDVEGATQYFIEEDKSVYDKFTPRPTWKRTDSRRKAAETRYEFEVDGLPIKRINLEVADAEFIRDVKAYLIDQYEPASRYDLVDLESGGTALAEPDGDRIGGKLSSIEVLMWRRILLVGGAGEEELVKTLKKAGTGGDEARSLARDFLRRNWEACLLDGREGQGTTLGQGAIYRYFFRTFKSEDLTIMTSERPTGHFFIRVVNHDDKPLEVTGVEAEVLTRALVFRPPEKGKLRVFFGAPEADKATYDLERLYSRVREKRPALGKLGPRLDNPSFIAKAKKPEPAPPRDYRLLIWLALVPAVLFVGWLVFKSMKDINAGSGEER